MESLSTNATRFAKYGVEETYEYSTVIKNGTFYFVTFLIGWGHDGTIVILPQRKFMFIPTPGNKS